MSLPVSPIAEMRNATIGYSVGKATTPIITGLNFSIQTGDFVAMVGPNGAGKTTLMRTLLGLNPILSGERKILGRNNPTLSSLSGQVAYVPQKMSLNTSVPITVREFLQLKGQKKPSFDEITAALKTVEMHDHENNLLAQLSGGQMQRVFVAFALLGKPKLICLDEATEGMDLKSQQSFLDLLKKTIVDHQASLLFISHDISAVSAHANRVVCVNRKVLYDGSPSSPDFHSCLHDVYGNESHIHGHSHGSHDGH